jgi:choline dehydrogenase-like flavoprotein
MALARGASADYDDWAKMTGDEGWKWENILPLMKELEDFRPERPEGFEGFARPNSADHGEGGPIAVGFGDVMVPGVETFFCACVEAGMTVCPDNNSGNPVGVGLAQFNVGKWERSYAANAFLGDQRRSTLKQLTVLTRTPVVTRFVSTGVGPPESICSTIQQERQVRLNKNCR